MNIALKEKGLFSKTVRKYGCAFHFHHYRPCLSGSVLLIFS